MMQYWATEYTKYSENAELCKNRWNNGDARCS